MKTLLTLLLTTCFSLGQTTGQFYYQTKAAVGYTSHYLTPSEGRVPVWVSGVLGNFDIAGTYATQASLGAYSLTSHAHSFGSLTNKPTTLSGYGITDAPTGSGTSTGANSGDNSPNSTYAADFRAANFVAGTNYLTPTGNGTGITNLNANNITTGRVAVERLVNTQTFAGNGGTITAGTRDALITTAPSTTSNYYLPNALTSNGYPAGARLTFTDMSTSGVTPSASANLRPATGEYLNGVQNGVLVLSTPSASTLLISDGSGRWNYDIRGVARGGIGVTTLTGIAKGNGTLPFTAAIAGTDYVLPSGNISGTAAGLSSTLAAASGGTGLTALGTGITTWWGTPTSANLRAALTDEIGTGSAYFVGGALGTPASVNLTNASALPLTTGVTGILPAANGGTNSASFGQYTVVTDSKATAAASDTIAATTWTTVTLQIKATDTGSNFTLASNVLTVVNSGVYRVVFSVPFYNTNDSLSRLRKTNGTAATLAVGSRVYAYNYTAIPSVGEARVTLTAGDTLALQCYAQSAGEIGHNSNIGDGEASVYSRISFFRE